VWPDMNEKDCCQHAYGVFYVSLLAEAMANFHSTESQICRLWFLQER
jgi:hypothetical protein